MNVIKRNHGQRKKIKHMQEVQKRQMTYELYRMGKDLRWGENKRAVTCAAKKFFHVGSSGQDVNSEKRNLFRLSRNQHLRCHICYFIKIFPWLCGCV